MFKHKAVFVHVVVVINRDSAQYAAESASLANFSFYWFAYFGSSRSHLSSIRAGSASKSLEGSSFCPFAVVTVCGRAPCNLQFRRLEHRKCIEQFVLVEVDRCRHWPLPCLQSLVLILLCIFSQGTSRFELNSRESSCFFYRHDSSDPNNHGT